MASPKPGRDCLNHKHSHGLPKHEAADHLPPNSPVVGMVSPQHQDAAVRLQKVYKSFRTRRQLADCAVLVEQRWWKLLDFALLKQSSVSFFEGGKPETALSRWSRARVRAAKVGKGLSKDEKAQKLALQHWLEACFMGRSTLDIGTVTTSTTITKAGFAATVESLSSTGTVHAELCEGKEVNLDDHCPRWKLLQQCIRYLGPAVWPHSGHYRPTEANFLEFMKYLRNRDVDLTNVKLSPSEGEEGEWLMQRGSLSEPDLTAETIKPEKQEDAKPQPPRADKKKKVKFAPAAPPSTSGGETAVSSPGMIKRSSSGTRLQRKRPPRLTVIKDRMDKGAAEQDAGAFGDCLDICKENLFRGPGTEGEEVVAVAEEKIMDRINSKMAQRSYQLGQQLSSRWTTGAGPRIGCVRDYPPELQFRSLEQVSLSPRGGAEPPRLGQKSPCAPPPFGAAGTPAAPLLLQHGAA
uniref:Uncharacterized protein n=1 Tax=Avena sativa TaxID=4498 RepID=A0ACD5TUY5_AVESA